MNTFTPLTRLEIACRAAQDFKNGMYINLGVGIPTLASLFVPIDREVVFQSENGILGLGPLASIGKENFNLVNASQQKVTLVTGGCFFDCVDAFMMLRGGHIDLALLGAFQVSQQGDLANWIVESSDVPPAVGGAMDIAIGAKEIWVLMQHCTKDGQPRLVSNCTYPLTASSVVSRVYTDLAVIHVTSNGFIVQESLDGLLLATLQQKTGAPLKLAENWRPLSVPAVDSISNEICLTEHPPAKEKKTNAKNA